MDMTLQSLMWAVAIAALAPILRIWLPGPKLAPVVFMIIGGILIGPQVAGLASAEDLTVLSDLGLGFLFLLAGYEIDTEMFRRRPGRLAIRSWLVSAALALAVTLSLESAGVINSGTVIAIGLTTTALGTLLPILRDADMLHGRFGSYIFSAGAVGEFLPIVAMAIFLSTQGAIFGLVSLIGLGALTLAVVKLIDYGSRHRWGARLGLSEHSTSQSTLRWTLVLLVFLLLIAQDLGIDMVMGAFLAGMVLRYWSPGDMTSLEQKLDAVGYGVFIPIFFVVSGMNLDVRSIIANPLQMLLFLALMLAVRGLPMLWLYRRDLDMTSRWQLALLGATALPVLVALSSVGVAAGVLAASDAASLIGAGVLSVIFFPTISVAMGHPDRRATPATPVAARADEVQDT